jgi:hypothetical protein
MLGAIVLAVIALAGCGGSTKTVTATAPATGTEAATTATSGTTTAAALTHEQFIAKLDDICKRGNAQAQKYKSEAEAAAKASDYAKLATVLQRSKNAEAPFLAEFAQLTPPAADEAAFARYKTANERIKGLEDRAIVALRARDTPEVERLGEQADSERKARTAAAIDLGTKNCGM